MIRMLVERLNCVTLRLSNTLFIYVLKRHNHGVRCYKRRAENKSYKIKYKALKELENTHTHANTHARAHTHTHTDI